MKSLSPTIIIIIIQVIIIIIIIIIFKQLRKWCKIPEWHRKAVLVS